MASFSASALILCIVLFYPLVSEAQTRHELVLDEGRYILGWVVNTAQQSITFDVAVQARGFVGLGVTATGTMYDSDIAIGIVFPNGTSTVTDYQGQGPFRPTEDAQQDWHILYGYESATHTYLRFTRALDTGDVAQDIPITNETTYIIWAWSVSDNLGYHGTNRGAVLVNLIQPEF